MWFVAGLASCIAAAVLAFCAGSASAAALRISPVGFEFAPAQRAASLSVRDDGDAPMTVQVRVYRWIQHGDANVLEPTDALLASPPFASLDPSAEQTVRLIRADTGAAVGGEQAFRLLVDELPPATGATAREVRLLMRHSVPVFVEPSQGTRAQVAWSGKLDPRAVHLHAVNSGGRRLRLANLRLRDAGGRVVASQDGLVGYVLAGAAITFDIPRAASAPGDAAPIRVEADTDLGRLDAALSPAT